MWHIFKALAFPKKKKTDLFIFQNKINIYYIYLINCISKIKSLLSFQKGFQYSKLILIANFIIREFFMTENPYDDLLNILTQPQSLFEFPEGRGIKRKEEPLIKTLFLTLSEVRSDPYISIFSFFTPILNSIIICIFLFFCIIFIYEII